MIRVFLYSDEILPSSVLDRLKNSEEIQIDREMTSSDIVVIFASTWNRSAMQRFKHFLQESKRPVVVICVKREEPFATDSVLQKKISGLLLSNSTGAQVLAGLRAVQTGLQVLQDFMESKERLDRDSHLTPRELEILTLVADGEGNKSIAELLEISEHTVKFHLSSIFEKLHVSTRTEAVKAGIMRGLISI
jgi:NarL family two-component system response regulator YdfI